jgi:hypothetical protein
MIFFSLLDARRRAMRLPDNNLDDGVGEVAAHGPQAE